MDVVRRLLLLVLLIACACGDPAATPADDGPKAAGARPFVVDAAPAGYRLVTAGEGTVEQDWGSDSFGTHEPFTLLTRDDDVIVVSSTGYEGYQGGLEGATGGGEDIEIDGRPAIFTEKGGTAVELLAVREDDLAIRVRAESSTRAELESILGATETPEERDQAPAVVDPPGGWRVAGSVHADLVVALHPAVLPNSDLVPGPRGSYGAGWTDGENFLSVVSLPSTATTLDLSVGLDAGWAGLTIRPDGRMVIDRSPPPNRWAVVTRDPTGALMVVSAEGRAAPSVDELVAVAASVKPVDEERWKKFMDEAAGGPGLHADEGAAEIARGEIDGFEWLLQTAPPTAVDASSSTIDPCLKLSNRRRVCAGSMMGGGGAEVHIAGEHDVRDQPFPLFAVVVSFEPATAVRISTEEETVSAPLHQIPEGRGSAAVVFVADPGWPDCSGRDSGGQPTMRIELLDATGAVVSCLGP